MKLAAAAMLVGTKPTAAQGVAMLEEAQQRRRHRSREDQHPAGAGRSDMQLQENFAEAA